MARFSRVRKSAESPLARQEITPTTIVPGRGELAATERTQRVAPPPGDQGRRKLRHALPPVEDRPLEDAPSGRRAGFPLLLIILRVVEGVGELPEAAVARRRRPASFFRREEALAPARAWTSCEG